MSTLSALLFKTVRSITYGCPPMKTSNDRTVSILVVGKYVNMKIIKYSHQAGAQFSRAALWVEETGKYIEIYGIERQWRAGADVIIINEGINKLYSLLTCKTVQNKWKLEAVAPTAMVVICIRQGWQA